MKETRYLASTFHGPFAGTLIRGLLACACLIALQPVLGADKPAPASSSAPPCVQAAAPADKAAAPPAQAAASKPAAASPAKPSAAKPQAIVPLQANGLIARSLRQIGLWADGLGRQLNEAKNSLFDLVALFKRTGGHIANAGDRHLLIVTGTALLGVFVAGLLLEWLAHLMLKRPLRAWVARANDVEARDRRNDVRQRINESKEASGPSASERQKAEAAKAAAGVRPSAEDIALVHTHEHGEDRVEPVRVGAQNTASGPQVDASGAPPAAAPRKEDGVAKTRRYVNTLHHLAFAFGALLFNLIPLGVFFFVAGLALRGLGGDDDRVHDVVSNFINAYVITRLIMAMLRLLVSPEGPGLCVLSVSHRTTRVLLTWVRLVVVIAAFGLACADALQTVGGGHASRIALIKLVSLLVHLAAVILILKLRSPVKRAIAAAPGAKGPVAALRNWLARVWVLFAVVFVLGVWVVWALGVEDGFPKLMHFIVVSAAILIAARIVAILLQGALGRWFCRHDGQAAAQSESEARRRLTKRYYPIVNGLVSFFLAVFTIIALLQSWGLDAVGWFAHDTVGHGLASASLTILVAAMIAISIWEAASFNIERRIAQWTEHGDLMRAARLRTLLPMMRTSLFIVVVLVVGLTALNQIGINTTPLLASASIVGVALGFGSQKLVQDFITGIFLLMENAMQVGDWVTVAGVSGTVEYLSVRTVRLRGGDGSLYTIPFSSVTTVNNSNRGLGNASLNVSIAHNTDVDRAMDELTKLARQMRGDPAFQHLILKDLEIWGVDAIDGSKVTIVGQMQCKDSGRWGVQRELNRRIAQRFRAIGIELAYPHASFLLAPGHEPSAARTSAKK